MILGVVLICCDYGYEVLYLIVNGICSFGFVL